MKYKPPKTNRAGEITAVFLIILSMISYGFTFSAIPFRGVLMFLFFVSLVFGIQFLIRFGMTAYHYELQDDNFIVVKTVGRRSTIVCNLTLKTALGIVSGDKVSSIPQNFGHISQKYNYCQNMFSKNSYYYLFEFNGKNGMIKFEPDDAFLEEFKQRMSAKEI